MKTLVNKNNPAVRITAPEIDVHEEEEMYFIPVSDYCIPMCISDWTLVEEDTLLQFRAKIKANQIIALDALKRAFVAGLLSKEEYDDGVSHINENTNDVLIDLPILNLVEEEPKHTEVWVEGRTIFEQEQKPSEWSEEDKFKLEDAITGIDVGIGFYEREGKHPNLLKAIVEAKEWLKSLRPQRKVEWSEEDLQHKSWILECLADGERKMPEYAEDFRAAYKWLKSLRPSWKPSDGQMAELNKVRTLNPGLDALYQQLKNM